MLSSIAADLVMTFHFLFVAFVVVGGALVLRWPPLLFAHVPAFSWGFLVAANHWTCPLTPLEQNLRRGAGAETYEGGFIAHYIEPIVYPDGMPWMVKMVFAVLLLGVNVAIWRWAWARRHQHRADRAQETVSQ